MSVQNLEFRQWYTTPPTSSLPVGVVPQDNPASSRSTQFNTGSASEIYNWVKLFKSVLFKINADDRAVDSDSVNYLSPTGEILGGHVTVATDIEAKGVTPIYDGDNGDESCFTRVPRVSQLPTVKEGVSKDVTGFPMEITDLPTDGINIEVDNSVLTRNDFLVSLSDSIMDWFYNSFREVKDHIDALQISTVSNFSAELDSFSVSKTLGTDITPPSWEIDLQIQPYTLSNIGLDVNKEDIGITPIVDKEIQLKSLVAGEGIELSSDGTDIFIAVTDFDATNIFTNIGEDGIGVFAGVNNVESRYEFRKIRAGQNIVLDVDGEGAIIVNAVEGGEGSGIIAEEDPTVPDHVKAITQQDIDNWNLLFELYLAGEFTGGDNAFDSDRAITKIPQIGEVVGGATLQEFTEAWYGFVGATLSVNNLTPAENGRIISRVITGNVVANSETEFLSQEVTASTDNFASVVGTFTAPGSFTVTTLPTVSQDTTYQIKLTVGNNGSTKILTSTTVLNFYSPSFYGVGAAGLDETTIKALVDSDPSATGMRKEIWPKSDRNNLLFCPTLQKFYYVYPASYGRLSTIIDPNDFTYFDGSADNGDDTLPFTNGQFTRRAKVAFTLINEVTSEDYYIYESNDETTQVNFQLDFKF